MQIHAIKIPDRIDHETFDRMLNVVTEEKSHAVKKFTKRKDAENTLAADLLVRWLIRKNTGLQYEEMQFATNRSGKPFLANHGNFHFNVSHSGCWVACATDTSEVGVDIEEVRPFDIELARSFFSCTEYHDLMCKQAPRRLHYFYDLWTLKESYIKAIGTGLNEPLPTFSICIDDQQINCTSRHGAQSFFFQKWDVISGYKLAGCAVKPQQTNTIHIHGFDELMRDVLL